MTTNLDEAPELVKAMATSLAAVSVIPMALYPSDAARAIVLDLAAGESLADHEVHERAWLIVLDGEVEVKPLPGIAWEAV